MTEQTRPTEGDADNARAKEEKSTPWYVEIPIIIVIALLLSVGVQTFIGRVYVIPSESMQPTLHGCEGCTGDRIWVDKISYRFSQPQPGDVVVFNGPKSWDDSFVNQAAEHPISHASRNIGAWLGLVSPSENALVKRVIATAGETVQCQPGDPGIMVNGKVIDSSYIKTPADYPVDQAIGSDACGGPYFGPVTIPENAIWVMGDNRTNSRDSRFHMGDEFQGAVPTDNVVGKVQAIILPFNRIGGVDDPDIQGK